MRVGILGSGLMGGKLVQSSRERVAIVTGTHGPAGAGPWVPRAKRPTVGRTPTMATTTTLYKDNVHRAETKSDRSGV